MSDRAHPSTAEWGSEERPQARSGPRRGSRSAERPAPQLDSVSPRRTEEPHREQARIHHFVARGGCSRSKRLRGQGRDGPRPRASEGPRKQTKGAARSAAFREVPPGRASATVPRPRSVLPRPPRSPHRPSRANHNPRAEKVTRGLAPGDVLTIVPTSQAPPGSWVLTFGDRLTAGRQFLVLAIEVRILVPEQLALSLRAPIRARSFSIPSWPHRLVVRTSASHAGNTSSSLVGVTTQAGPTQPTASGLFSFQSAS